MGLIKETDFTTMEQKQKSLKLPSDVGRICYSVCRVYKTMKADEWKHWVLLYSMHCLRGILPDRDINIWW